MVLVMNEKGECDMKKTLDVLGNIALRLGIDMVKNGDIEFSEVYGDISKIRNESETTPEFEKLFKELQSLDPVKIKQDKEKECELLSYKQLLEKGYSQSEIDKLEKVIEIGYDIEIFVNTDRKYRVFVESFVGERLDDQIKEAIKLNEVYKVYKEKGVFSI